VSVENAAGSGLQSANCTKMRGTANEPRAILPTRLRTQPRQCRSLASTGAACGMPQVPGLWSFSGEDDVWSVAIQEFGSVVFPRRMALQLVFNEEHRGASCWDVILAETESAKGGGRPARDVDAALTVSGTPWRGPSGTATSDEFSLRGLLAGAPPRRPKWPQRIQWRLCRVSSF